MVNSWLTGRYYGSSEWLTGAKKFVLIASQTLLEEEGECSEKYLHLTPSETLPHPWHYSCDTNCYFTYWAHVCTFIYLTVKYLRLSSSKTLRQPWHYSYDTNCYLLYLLSARVHLYTMYDSHTSICRVTSWHVVYCVAVEAFIYSLH